MARCYRGTITPREVLDALIDQFFNSVNSFMMVFHEEHFRRRYENLMTSTQDVGPVDNNIFWLALLVLGLGAHYASLDASTGQDEKSLRRFSETLLTRAEHRFCRIIGSPNVEAVQVCILLGSFHLFNGRPTVGIGILGSGVKIAQIMGSSSQKAKAEIMAIIRLHRNSFLGQHLLSAQNARILEDVVTAVMQHEQQLILGNPPPRSVNVQRSSSNEDAVTTTGQEGSQVPGTSQAAPNEAFLTPLREVFAHHLQDGARRAESPTDAMDEQIPQNMASSFEESPMLGPPNFSWDGDLYSMIDPDFADAN